MKKLLLLLLLVTVLFTPGRVNAQWVTIPTQFAQYISQYVAASAINGSQLDTTNTTVLTTVDMTISDYNVTDITGIQYFKGLQNLVVFPSIISFPQLPAGLYSFESDAGTATSFNAPLPPALGAFKIYNGAITAVPALPSTLAILILNNDLNITTIPALPAGLLWLSVSGCTGVTSMAALPAGLYHLDLSYSPYISPLPALPSGLSYLNLSQSTYGPIASLQASLDTFICSYCTNITSLPDAPAGLVFIDVDHCNITTTGTLPNTMLDYILTANPITTIQYLPDTLTEFLELDSLPNITAINMDSIAVGYGISMNDCPNYGATNNEAMPNIIQNVHNAFEGYNISISANNDNILTIGQFNAFFDSLDLSYNLLNYMGYQGPVNVWNNQGCSNCGPMANGATLNFSNCQLTYIDQSYFATYFYNFAYPGTLDIDNNNLGYVSYLPPQVGNFLQMNNCQITGFDPTVIANVYFLDLRNNPNLTCLPFLDNVQYLYTSGDAANCVPDIPQPNNFYSDEGLTLCQQGNSNGCPVSSEAGGVVFNDTGGLGYYEPYDTLLPGYNVEMEPGGFFHVSDNTGHYIFQCQNDVNYTITGWPTLPYRKVTTPAYNEYFSTYQTDTFATIGIYTQPDVNDMEVILTAYEQPRPGFHQDYNVTAWNVGSTVENGQVVMYFNPSLLTYQSSTPPGTVNGGTITWDITNMPYATQFNANIDFIVPVPVPLGTPISAGAHAYCNLPDTTPLNNNDTVTGIAYGSYDPNNKSVSPTGPLAVEQIAAGNYLTYTVRFQNTGTGSAVNIVVSDTLDSGLNLGTFQFVTSSAVSTWSIDNGVLTVTFSNINLPDSAQNEPGSHGFFTYRIKAISGATPGQVVQNTAYVYFDFNAPVATNTATTAITAFITQQPQSQVLCNGEPLLLTIAVNHQLVQSLQWYKNGQPTGNTTDTIKAASATTANNGNYYVMVLAGNGQYYKSDMAAINVVTNTTTPPTFSISPDGVVNQCTGGAQYSTFNVINLNNALPNTLFNWYLNDSLLQSNVSQSFAWVRNYKSGDRLSCYPLAGACQNQALMKGDSAVFVYGVPDTLHLVVTPTVVHICSGEDATLSALVTNASLGLTNFYWTANGYFLTSYDTATVQGVTANTTVIVQVDTSGMCPSVVCNLNGVYTGADTVQIIVDGTGTPPPGQLTIGYRSNFCPQTDNIFYAEGSQLGASPQYYWYQNDTLAGYTTTDSWTSYGGLEFSGHLQCQVTRNICGVTDTVISNTLVLGPDSVLMPQVSITVGYPGYCNNSAILYANAINNLTNPSGYTYYWYQNGVPVDSFYSNYANMPTYITRSYNGGADTILLVMVTGVPCYPLDSSTIILPLQVGDGPFIYSAAGDTVCPGTTLSFSTNSNYNGDVEWVKNGIPVDTTYQDGAYVVNNDSVDFTLYAIFFPSLCMGAQNSDTLHIHYTHVVTIPQVQIQPNQLVYCADNLPTFSLSTNLSNPNITWLLNDYVAGIGDPTINFSNWYVGDSSVLVVEVSPNENCVPAPGVFYDTILINTITEKPVAWLDTGLAVLCGTSQGQTFTVQNTFGGAYPTYRWYLNGLQVGTDANYFTDTHMAPGDSVYCVMTSNSTCANGVNANSDTLILYHASPVMPTVSISAQTEAFCPDIAVTLTASGTNTGNAPVYQWQINGADSAGNGNSFTVTAPVNNEVVRCLLSSSLSCVTSPSVVSNADTLQVNPAPPLPVVTVQGDTLTSTTGLIYQWYLNNVVIPGATGQTLITGGPGYYYVVTSNADGCRSQSAGTLLTTGIDVVSGNTVQVRLYPNPNNGNFILQTDNDGIYDVEIYDVLGRMVTAPAKVWRKQEFDLSTAAPGIYIVSILQNQQQLQRIMFSLER